MEEKSVKRIYSIQDQTSVCESCHYYLASYRVIMRELGTYNESSRNAFLCGKCLTETEEKLKKLGYERND